MNPHSLYFFLSRRTWRLYSLFSLTLSVLDNRTELNINSFEYLELLLVQFLYRVGVSEVIIAFRRRKNRSEKFEEVQSWLLNTFSMIILLLQFSSFSFFTIFHTKFKIEKYFTFWHKLCLTPIPLWMLSTLYKCNFNWSLIRSQEGQASSE